MQAEKVFTGIHVNDTVIDHISYKILVPVQNCVCTITAISLIIAIIEYLQQGDTVQQYYKMINANSKSQSCRIPIS